MRTEKNRHMIGGGAHKHLKNTLKITLLFASTYFKMNIMEPLLSMVMTGDPIFCILKIA